MYNVYCIYIKKVVVITITIIIYKIPINILSMYTFCEGSEDLDSFICEFI